MPSTPYTLKLWEPESTLSSDLKIDNPDSNEFITEFIQMVPGT